MSFDDLAIFVAVARRLSFSAAATGLSLPPSRVSRRIAMLEDELGMKLFERTTRQVRLTHEGRQLLDRCGAPIEALEAALHGPGRPANGNEGVIRITAPPLAARSTVGPKLLDFMSANPDVSIELVSTNARLDFIRDDIDLAFRLGPLDESDLIVRRLWAVPYTLCAASSFARRHGLTGRADAATVLGLPAISTGQLWRFDGVPPFAPRHVRHVIDDLELALSAVRAGLGVGLLPREMLTSDVVAIEVATLSPQARDMHAVYPSRRLLPRRVRALMDHMIAQSASGG